MVFPGKLAIQQRVLASYRAPFFNALAKTCTGGLSVCAGQPMPDESITITNSLQEARYKPVRNLHLFRGSLLLCYQQGLVDWLGDWDPDVLITEVNARTISTPVALRWMRKHSRPVMGWGLGSPPPASFPGILKTPGENLVRSTLRQYLRHFDGLLTYSRRGAEEYAALGFPADRIFIAPNAVTPPPIHPLPVRPERFDGRPTILFVGRLQKRKRVDTLLQACASLPMNLQPNLVIVGGGPEYDSLSLLAKQIYPLAKFPGALHGADLAPLFLAADLFVLPGTGGLAVQEAMSYGLPIIMGAGDGTNDDLVRPENGWQLPNLEALTVILKDALSDVSRLRDMGAVSYRIVAKEINLDRMVLIFLQALQTVTSG